MARAFFTGGAAALSATPGCAGTTGKKQSGESGYETNDIFHNYLLGCDVFEQGTYFGR